MKTMSKLMMYALSATFLLSLVLFSGCGNDDDEPSGLPLEGTLWTETSYSATGCDDPDDNESGTSSCTSTECYTIRLSAGTITFEDTEGGTKDTSTGTYTISGNTINVNFGGINLPVTYTISGSTLTIKLDSPFGGCQETTTYSGA